MSEWHADADVLERWAGGRARMPEAASLEQHLLSCPDCRALVDESVAVVRPESIPDRESIWSLLRDEIELPRMTLTERIFCRIGLPPSDARLIAQAPMFRTEWMTAVLAVLMFAAAAAAVGHSRGLWLFLAIAPLVPAAAVALCFDPRIEPALEQELTTPYSAIRLVLLRTAAVLVAGLPVLLMLGLLVPGSDPYLWLLPAAGFVAAVLALSTWTTPLRAAAAIAVAWLAAVSAAAQVGSVRDVLRGPFAIAYIATAVSAIAVLAVRNQHLREARQRGGWS